MAAEKVAIEIQIQNDKAISSVKDMRKALKEAKGEVLAMQAEFGEFSQEAVQAANRVALLNDRMGDAKSLVEKLNPDRKFQAFSNAIQGVVGGFAGLQGAIGLFGTKSEEVEKQLLKVQSALALSEGLNSLIEARESFTILAAVIKGKVLDAFKAMKVAIGSTGIGLIVLAVGLLVANFDKLKKALVDTFPALGNIKQLFNDVLQVARGTGEAIMDFLVAPFKALGKVLSGDFSGAIDELKSGLNVVKNYTKGVNDEITRQGINAANDRLEALVKSQEKELEILQARGKSTIALERKILQEKLILYRDDEQKYEETQQALRVINAKGAKEREDADKAAADKKKAADEKAKKEAEAKAKQDADELTKLYEDAIAANVKVQQELELVGKDSRQKQLIEIARWFEEQKEIYRKGNLDIVNLIALRDAKIDEVTKAAHSDEVSKLYSHLDNVKAKFAEFGAQRKEDLTKDVDDESQTLNAKIQIRNQYVDAVSSSLNSIQTLFKKGSAASKIAALGDIAIGTGVGFINALEIAQKSAKATGPGAAFAFPIFYATQVAAVLAAAARAKSALNSGGGASVSAPSINIPTNASAPITPTANVSTTRLDNQTIDDLGNKALSSKAYVLESEITDSQVRQRRIERAARLGG